MILLSTPAPAPVWVQEAYFPAFDHADTDLVALNTDRWAWRSQYWNNPPSAATPMLVAGPSAGGGGVLKRHELARGVAFALRYSTTGALAGDTWRLPFIPSLIDPAATTGHLIGREDARVTWYRIPVADVAGTGGATDGHAWSWDIGGVIGVNWAPNGAAVQQIVCCGDGAGGMQYRSYSAAPALLETVALPYTAGVWNVFDHVFISSAPGRAPHYDLYLNGTRVISRDFGTGVLPFVTQPRLQLVTMTTVAASVWYYAYIHARAGRFGPDGKEFLS